MDAARGRRGAAAAEEKNAFVFFALCSALRERRCTPREESMVDDVDVGEDGRQRAARSALSTYKVYFHAQLDPRVPTSSDFSRRSRGPRCPCVLALRWACWQ